MQCAVPLRWEPDRLAALLVAGPDLAVDLTGAVTPVAVPPHDVVDAFLGALPAA
jgi:hypothetical protein